MEFHDQSINNWREFDSGRTYSGFSFTNCDFRGCTLALDQENLALRPRVTDITLRSCTQLSCSIRGLVVENVLVDCLRTSGLFQTWAAVFKHVTLRGKIDGLMFSNILHPSYPTQKFQHVVNNALADYYSGVDWALDIREAEFRDFDCRGVPSRLVRRDPETQIMITRERALASGSAIAAGGSYWEGIIKFNLQQLAQPDFLLVTPKQSKRRSELIAGLRELRRAGVAEPD